MIFKVVTIGIVLIAQPLCATTLPKPQDIFDPSALSDWTTKPLAKSFDLGEALDTLGFQTADKNDVIAAVKAVRCQGLSEKNCEERYPVQVEAKSWSRASHDRALFIHVMGYGWSLALLLEAQGQRWKIKHVFEDGSNYEDTPPFPVTLGGQPYLVMEGESGGTNIIERRFSLFRIDSQEPGEVARVLTYCGTFNVPDGFEYRVDSIGNTDAGHLEVKAYLDMEGVSGDGHPVYSKRFDEKVSFISVSSEQKGDSWAWLPDGTGGYLDSYRHPIPALQEDAPEIGQRISQGDLRLARWIHYLLHYAKASERSTESAKALQHQIDDLPESKAWTLDLNSEDEASK